MAVEGNCVGTQKAIYNFAFDELKDKEKVFWTAKELQEG